MVSYFKHEALRRILLLLILIVSVAVNAQTERKFLRDGNRLFNKQQYDKAEVMYRKAVAKNPSNSQALYNLGCALMMQGKDSAAINMYQNAAKTEKSKLRLAQAYHNIGVICQNHQMYADAITSYQMALRNNPKDDETRYNLILCKRLQKKQPQNKNKDNKKQQKNKDKDKSNDNKNLNNKQKDKDKKNQQKPEEQMSKDNAEQLLNAAMQNEKNTQQRLRKAQQKASSRRLQKNW